MGSIKHIFITALLVLCFCCTDTFSQSRGTITNTGYLEGQLMDSVHNYVLKSATVSVYDSASLDIVSYQLSNTFGRFSFNNLPVARPLKLIVTFVGYQPLKKIISIPADTKKLDLKVLNVFTAENNLDEVKIYSAKPPMQMQGDTLVFNADAFKLDTNAVVEDLLRKLPAVTLWNDGLITVNGKKINSLLVNGKIFFGGNTKIATQNLPKNAVDKIQVYEHKLNKEDLDPQTEMNIVLKKNKNFGYFGKFGGGYGTDRRYAGEGMLSLFNPKAQLSIIGTRNNVNKTASSVEDLMQYSSFKGEGMGTSFSSDFTKPGENTNTAAGYALNYNFSTENKMRNDYFYTNGKNLVEEDLTMITSLEDGTVEQINNRNRSGKSVKNRNFGDFVHAGKSKQLTVRYELEALNGQNSFTQDISTRNSATDISSRQTQIEDAKVNESHALFFASFDSNKYYDSKSNAFKSINLNLDYSFKLDKSDNLTEKKTQFIASDNPVGLDFNRRFDRKVSEMAHTLNNKFRNIPSWFGIKNALVNVDFKNHLVSGTYRETDLVTDWNADKTAAQINTYLSNRLRLNTILERPGIEISKSLKYFLANRYSRTWSFRAMAEVQGFEQHNVSQQQFQRITKSYIDFLPSATARLSYLKNNKFTREMSLNLVSTMNYPRIHQLVPLTDSSNVNFLEFANRNLKAAKATEIAAKYQYGSVGNKNPLSYSLDLKAGRIKDNLTDSSFFDGAGRNIHYYANVSHAEYAGYLGTLYKAYNLKGHQFQLTLRSLLDLGRQPAYINSRLISTRNAYYLNSLTIGESYKGIVNVSLGQSVAFNDRWQSGQKYTYRQLVSTLNFNLNWPKHVTLNSDLNYNRNTSSYSESLNYTIWNANVSYRFLKGDNAELKFSAMDLLHQNNSVVNFRDSYSISRGRVNVLQQYFLFSIAYFPRKFGKGD